MLRSSLFLAVACLMVKILLVREFVTDYQDIVLLEAREQDTLNWPRFVVEANWSYLSISIDIDHQFRQ
ncbi:MAG: hypothetical protein Q8M16_07080 [Pirellulaceae bacterium]|nr:hypothetical protein [Pirellulaceae bacterium]